MANLNRMAEDTLETDESLWQALRRGFHPVDVLLLASVPVAILGVFALSPATRETLVFQYTTPSIPTAFTAPFVHFDSGHLLFNLVGYTLVVPILYALSLDAGDDWEFRVVFVALLASSPILLSYLNLTILRSGVTFGFSGVLMAYYGYLPLVVAKHATTRLQLGDTRTAAPLLFFLGLLLATIQLLRAVVANPVTVAVDGAPASVTWVLVATLAEVVVLLLLVIVFYSLSGSGSYERLRASARRAFERGSRADLTIVALLVLVAMPFVTFPVDPIAGQRVFNLYVHFVGYALGFISTYVYHTL